LFVWDGQKEDPPPHTHKRDFGVRLTSHGCGTHTVGATKDEEERRINKEMAHIRKQFKEQSSQKLDGYNRKKYVSKLLYMYLLGYEPDFGYMEAVRLLSGKRFTEKQIVRRRSLGRPPSRLSLALCRPSRPILHIVFTRSV
jgi:hypothetical protein